MMRVNQKSSQWETATSTMGLQSNLCVLLRAWHCPDWWVTSGQFGSGVGWVRYTLRDGYVHYILTLHYHEHYDGHWQWSGEMWRGRVLCEKLHSHYLFLSSVCFCDRRLLETHYIPGINHVIKTRFSQLVESVVILIVLLPMLNWLCFHCLNNCGVWYVIHRQNPDKALNYAKFLNDAKYIIKMLRLNIH